MQFERASSAAFSFWMTGLFAYAVFFPSQTGSWILQTGFLILIFEGMSVIATLFLALRLKKETGIVAHGLPLRSKSILIFVASLIVLLAWCAATGNLLLFAFFLVSSGVKFMNLRSKKDALDEGREINSVGLLFVLSYLLVFLTAPFFSDLQTLAPGSAFGSYNGSEFAGPFGFYYFLLSGIFGLASPKTVDERIISFLHSLGGQSQR